MVINEKLEVSKKRGTEEEDEDLYQGDYSKGGRTRNNIGN